MAKSTGDSRRETESRPFTGRVLVVDDEQVVRTFVKRILEHEGHVVATADSVKTGLQAIKSDLDVAVLDVDLPDGEGFELVDAIRKHAASPTPVIMITGNPSDEALSRSLSQGLIEFLFKPFRAAELRAAVERAVAAKRRWESRVDALSSTQGNRQGPFKAIAQPIPMSEVSRLLKNLSERHGLTEREQETLSHMLAGLQNTDIAETLDISANTVKYHVRNILTKLGMESRTELFRSLLNQRK